jgi:hypothetical protein
MNFSILNNCLISIFASYLVADLQLDHSELFYGTVSKKVGMDEPFVGFVLKSLVDKGFLKFDLKGNQVKWFWTRNEELSILPR